MQLRGLELGYWLERYELQGLGFYLQVGQKLIDVFHRVFPKTQNLSSSSESRGSKLILPCLGSAYKPIDSGYY